MITTGANALVLTAAIAQSIDNIDVISISDEDREVFRKSYQNKEIISNTERKYTFYLTEAEANTVITKLSLFGNGATVTLGDGIEIAEQAVNIHKTNTQSLLIYWIIRLV